MGFRIASLAWISGGVGVVSIATGAGIGVVLEPFLPDPLFPFLAVNGAPSNPLEIENEFDDAVDFSSRERDEEPRALPNQWVALEHAAEHHAAHAHESRSSSLPLAPEETGLLGAITNARVEGEDRDAFYLAVYANRRAESGTQGARFSTLRTTAGPDHRASYGDAQLTIRDHLFYVLQLSDSQLRELGVLRSELTEMQRRGENAGSWYHLLVDRRDIASASSRIDVRGADIEMARMLASQNQLDGLIVRFGRRFANSTGLPGDAIEQMAITQWLRQRNLRENFRRRYQREHGSSFDPSRRDLGRMCATARALAREDQQLGAVLDALGGRESGAASLAHYLGVGDVGENYYGWYARAARQAVGAQRYQEILAVSDPVSTRLRELSNFQNAMAAVRGVRDLMGIERARMLTRIGRCFHGAPGRARDAFFFDDDPSRPRASTATELEAGIQEYRLGRPWSDARVQRAFDELVEERGGQR